MGALTGSALGQFVVLAGALANARFNRQRDDAIRETDRIALAAALYAELQGIHETFVMNTSQLAEEFPDAKEQSEILGDQGGFWVPGPTIKIFPEMLSKIGLLRADTIREVMAAYILVEQYLDGLILYDGKAHTKMPDRTFVYMPAQRAAGVAKINIVKACAVKQAMQALAPYLK
jgi:hypothetical protein